MKHFLVILAGLIHLCQATLPASDRIEFIYTECKTETEKCQIGEGDCDSDDDCEYGLICDADGWIGKDFCKAGPKTTHGKLTQWGPWGECSSTDCNTWGQRNRTRSCIPPTYGGYQCPSSKFQPYLDLDNCKPPCGKAACNHKTWDKFTWDCCTKKEPCYVGEGDCDNDDECANDLVCGKNNCPAEFKAKFGKNKPDCCEKPGATNRQFEGHEKCDGLCKQGEGDCNWDSDCVEGLVCDYGWGLGKDFCIAGPKTKNAIVTQWSEWSKCSNSACGTLGVTFRRRSCIPPEFGGYDCPSNTIWDQYKRCRGEPCPPTTEAPTTEATTTEAPTTEAPTTEAPTTEAPTTEAPTTAGPKSKAACNPATWEKFSWACCTKKDPCYIDEGDCDNDAECAGDLVCGKNNCPETFTVRRGKNRPDCCMKPEA